MHAGAQWTGASSPSSNEDDFTPSLHRAADDSGHFATLEKNNRFRTLNNLSGYSDPSLKGWSFMDKATISQPRILSNSLDSTPAPLPTPTTIMALVRLQSQDSTCGPWVVLLTS